MILQLLAGGIVGAGAILTLGWWLEHREDRMIDAFLQEEEDRYTRIFELLLVGIEPPECEFYLVAPSPVEQGVAVIQMILEEEGQLKKFYARADGLDITIIGFQEFAAIASYDLVKAIPCVEDMESDDFWEDDEDEDDYEEA
jgi:hypothetical protein